MRMTDIHHRRARSIGGKGNKRNCIRVPKNQHEAYHLLFRNYTPEIVAEILNKYWIDPNYQLVCLKRDFSKIEICEKVN